MTRDQVPYLTVVRGEPTDTELAAVVAVITARGAVVAAAAGREAGPRQGRPGWASRYRLVRQPVHAGPGAWRASARGW